jgi:hypothetical protein
MVADQGLVKKTPTNRKFNFEKLPKKLLSWSLFSCFSWGPFFIWFTTILRPCGAQLRPCGAQHGPLFGARVRGPAENTCAFCARFAEVINEVSTAVFFGPQKALLEIMI